MRRHNDVPGGNSEEVKPEMNPYEAGAKGRRIVLICAAGLTVADVVFPIMAYLSAGQVSGFQSFTRPVVFALVGWAAYTQKAWARWFLVVVCAIGGVLWWRQVLMWWDLSRLMAVIFLVGGALVISISLVLLLSDDVAAHFQTQPRA